MDQDFWLFFAIGFGAQIVDGCLGMAYGVVSTSALLSVGVPPASASASVHAAKIFTGAVSAASHVLYKNIDWKLLTFLSLGGVFGGIGGTYLITSVDGNLLRPYVVAWLLLMGLTILYRAWRDTRARVLPKIPPLPLGLVGGFFDAVGGGGWGPLVTSTLMSSGRDVRKAIGTANFAELFVAVAVSASFLSAIATGHWETEGIRSHLSSIFGLVVGGLCAAPLAGWLVKILPLRLLTWGVGGLVTALAFWQLLNL